MRCMKHTFLSNNRLALALWFRLARFYHKSNSASSKHVSKWGLTLPQFDTLMQIQAFQPITQNELADKLFVTKGNVTHNLVKLEQECLIKRTRQWRSKTIELTEKGIALLNDVGPKQAEFQASLFSALTKEEQKQLLSLLRKLHKDE